MNYKELEQEVKRLEEQITELKSKVLEGKAKLKSVPYRPYEVEVPEDIGTYYILTHTGYIQKNAPQVTVERLYKRGLAFKTREEAEQHDEERQLLFKMHEWADEHNEGWIPDWESPEDKYRVGYNHITESFEITDAWRFCNFTKLPYFKIRKVAEQFIEEFGKEIKEVLL